MRTVGRYELLREIRTRWMATVYLARQPKLGRYVALKELARFHQPDPAFAQRFLQESQLIAALSHPNIITIHISGRRDGPYYRSWSISSGVNAETAMSVGALSLGTDPGSSGPPVSGSRICPEHGIVHRDLKPENLMLTKEGQGEDRRLRHRQGDQRTDDRTSDRDRHDRGNAGVHGAGAGDGPGDRARTDLYSLA